MFDFDRTGLIKSDQTVRALHLKIAGAQGKEQTAIPAASITGRMSPGVKAACACRDSGYGTAQPRGDSPDTIFPTIPAAFNVQCDRMQGFWKT